MNYNLTMKELLEMMQKQLNGLKGKNVVKEGGISKLVEDALNNMEINLLAYNIEVDGCTLYMYCSGIDKNIDFANIRPMYRPDKRKFDGYGDYLESVNVELVKNIPMEMEVINASQFLDYNEAKENFKKLEKQQKELLKEYKENLESMKKLQNIMKYQAYDKDTTRESEKAKETLKDLYLR